MASLFGSPKVPQQQQLQAPAPPPPAPTVVDADAQAQDRADQLRRRRGRLSTILVPDQSMMPTSTTGASSILG